MIDFRKFKGGGMDTDSSPQEVAQNDWIEAWQFLTVGNEEGEADEGTNLRSTVEVVGYTLPEGINKCIGAQGFEQQRVAYFFIYNSFGYHQLVEFKYDDNIKTLLFTDLTDTGGVQVLALNPRKYVMDIKLADGNILIFTDSNIEIGNINIDRLKSGGYGVVKVDDFRLIKAQPLKIPTAVYGDDTSRVVNFLKDRLFQFRNKYNYLDDEPSTYSSISKRETPTKEATTSVGEDVTKNNNLIVTIDIGTDRVKSIDIAARYSMYDWFTIKTVLRSYVTSLPNVPIDIPNEIYERYNPADNTYSFIFYNDGSYPNINPVFTDQEYDFVPRKAESLELLESNILTVAGITEGYERPVVEVNIGVSNYDPNLEEAPTDPDPFRVVTIYNTDPSGKIHKRKIWVGFNGVAKTGDVITIVIKDFRNASVTKTYSYTVESAFNNNTLGALQKMAINMGNNGGAGGVGAVAYSTSGSSQSGIAEYILTWIDFEYYGSPGDYANVKNASVGSGILSSVQSLKLNSSYQLMLQHYDDYGRALPGNTGDNYVINTSSYAQSKGFIPKITWAILSSPPIGAASAQWLLSENATHLRTLYVNAKYLRTDGQYIVLSINPLKIFNERNSSSILNYDYSEGDRVTFNYYLDGSTKVYFDDPFIDVQVVGFDIVVDTVPDPDTTTFELKIRLNPDLDIAAITNKNVYIEIYTPKKRVITEGDTTTYFTNLFYEIGEQILITDGAYEQTSGTITDGDTFFQTRDYVSAVDETTYSTYLAEDFNFSALYKSNYTSYGRGFLYNERDGIKERKAGMRYSDKKLVNTQLNMLNKFFGERLYGDGDGETSSTFGWIRKIRLRDNYLVILQEVKVGHVPVFNTIVEDQAGQNQAFLSDKLFNKARYSQTGNRGMGNARECYSESPNGTIYFVDPNNSVPMREGYDGLRDISGKMSKFFKKTIQKAKQLGRDIISIWDNYTNTNSLSINVPSDEVISVPINSTYLAYQDPYELVNTDITITQAPTKGTITIISGEWVFTPTIGQSGSDSFKISFEVDGDVIEKNVCVTIEAGNGAPIPFIFNDVINADVSTLYVSNTILLTGMDNSLPFNVTGGEYSIDGGVTWMSGGGIVEPDTEIIVRRLSSPSTSTTVSVTLTVGTYSDSYDITTKSDPDPDPFTFIPVVDAEISTQYESNAITVLGIDVAISISITDGEYEINDSGIWTSLNGTVVLNDTVKVRRLSSSLYSTVVSTALDLNGVLGYFNITTKEEPSVGNEYRSINWQKDDCTGGNIGTVVVVDVEPNTYFAETLAAANDLADAWIEANKVSVANSQGYCLAPSTNSIAIIDMFDDDNLDVGIYIDTAGITESGVLCYTGQNFYLPTDPAATAFLLASDPLIGSTNKRRFAVNVGKLIGMYPDAGAIPKFTFRIRGRSTSAGIKNGQYSLKDPTRTLIMGGSPGTYQCAATPPGGPAALSWSGPCVGGGDGSIGMGIGAVIVSFEYDRAVNTFLQI